MRRIRVKACAAIFLSIVLGGCSQSPEAKRDKYLASGKGFLEKKDYPRAILAFKNAAKTMPNDAEPYYQLGLAALLANDIRTGALALKKSTELNPKHIAAQLKLAELMAQGNEVLIREAEKRLLELRDTAPVTPEMLNILAYTELRLGKTGDAVQMLEELLAKNPGESTAALLLARAKLAAKDVKGAEEVLQKALAASPKTAQPHVILGDFYRITDRPGDAETQYRAALNLDPNNVPALYSLAGGLYGLGRIQEAEAAFQRLAALPESPYSSIYALFMLRQGRHEEAVREFERLAKQNPNDRKARTYLVSAYQMVGRTNDAANVLQAALKKNPKDIDALVQRAQLAVASGKYEDAERDLNGVIQLQPDLAQVHYFLGKLHQGRGQDARYRQELFKAVQIEPLFLAARLDLAQSFTAAKDTKGALALLDAAPESQRTSVPVVVQRNWVLWAMGDMAQMRKGIDAGLAEVRSADLLLQDGVWKLRSGGNPAGARASLEEALKVDPRDVRALSALRQSYDLQKQTGQAVEKVKEYAAQEPRSAPVQNFLGALLLTRGDRAGARTAFQAAKTADPHSVEADFSLVQVNLVEGKFDDAKRGLQAMISADATNTNAHLWLGNVESTRGDYQAAMEQFRTVLAARPDDPEALNNLAYLLAEHANQTTEALKYAQRAKELVPDSAEYSDTLGWVLYRQGLYPMAVKELERATAKQSSVTSQYHLAMAYAKAGDWNRGRAVLKTALERNPKLPEAQLARQVLDAAPSPVANRH
jgi:tetratricopeptide (TPR) repeat protein